MGIDGRDRERFLGAACRRHRGDAWHIPSGVAVSLVQTVGPRSRTDIVLSLELIHQYAIEQIIDGPCANVVVLKASRETHPPLR